MNEQGLRSSNEADTERGKRGKGMEIETKRDFSLKIAELSGS